MNADSVIAEIVAGGNVDAGMHSQVEATGSKLSNCPPATRNPRQEQPFTAEYL